jgi:hypothetical protein
MTTLNLFYSSFLFDYCSFLFDGEAFENFVVAYSDKHLYPTAFFAFELGGQGLYVRI